VKDIIEKINQILSSESYEQPLVASEDEMVESYEELEFDEFYSDIYILVRNIDEFYGVSSDQKAAELLESFLLETMILLKKNPENIVVESGEFYVKATSFTPDGEVLMSVFEDAVIINTMIGDYNDALAQNEFPRMDIGIGIASFVKEELEEEEHVCECGDDDEECSCGHDHHHEEDEFDYGIDFNNTASQLSEIAGAGELDPIVINDFAFELLSAVHSDFFNSHLEQVELDDEITVYHGNIISEE